MRRRLALGLAAAACVAAVAVSGGPQGGRAAHALDPCPQPELVAGAGAARECPDPEPDPPAPPETHPPDRLDDVVPFRLQVRLVVGDVSDAGTDDTVEIRLNSRNLTYLDSPVDDFQAGSSRVYDVKLDGVTTLKDIDHLLVRKSGGDDGICLSRVDLLVNGATVFDATLGGSSPCQWFDGDPIGKRFDSAALRGDDRWRSFAPPGPPTAISVTEWRQRIEGIVGDLITGNPLYWGGISGPAVELSGITDSSGHQSLWVDLDLKADASVLFIDLPDPTVDIDFVLDVTCRAGTLTIESTNIVIDPSSDAFWRIVTFNLVEFLDAKVQKSVQAAFTGIDKHFPIGLCPTITIDRDGTTRFGLPGSTPTTSTTRPTTRSTAPPSTRPTTRATVPRPTRSTQVP
jgi:hypothetical protein